MRGVVRRERGAGDSDENVPKVNVSVLGDTVQRSEETTQAAMLIWVAVEVKRMGSPGCGLLPADWQGRRGSECYVLLMKERASL